MRLKFILLFPCILVLINNSIAQNLIPNPGFESFFAPFEYQWVQPQGPFYHYEKPDPRSDHKAFGGKYINGICMYSHEPNEYLHVKLTEPLKANTKYRLSTKARVLQSKQQGAYSQMYIGAFFGNEAMNTHIPGDLFMEPQVNLALPKADRTEWFDMAESFTADGGEQYLTIGYFFNTRTKEARDSYINAEVAANNRKYAASRVSEDDKAWLYLSPKEQKAYLKENKKKLRKQKKENDQNQTYFAYDDSIRLAAAKLYQDGGPADASFFRVRYYFDDMCLVEEMPDSSETCAPSDVAEKIEVGSTIQLRNVFFKSGESVLYAESDFQLNALKRILDDNPTMRIEIRGYTDNVGKDEANLLLSEHRARAVTEWLQAQEIESNRLSSKGFGATNFVDVNTTEAGRANNRRVTFYIISM